MIMYDKSDIIVEKVKDKTNTFEISINDKSPLKMVAEYMGAHTEDHIKNIIRDAQEKAHEHIMSMQY